MDAVEQVDVLIIGAGISGIGAAYYLQREHPAKSYAILEARGATGGTWDLFRYPGIRSDSDLQTFGYEFRPWTAEKSIADAASILAYLRETAAAYGIERKIRLHHKVHSAAWSTKDARWLVDIERTDTGARTRISCTWIFCASGYYRYDQGFTPHFAGTERFTGPIVHPQHWPADLDYAGKRVVVIGSGATAVTLVPALAETAAHVTMLQRTPTYILPTPSVDPFTKLVRKLLPLRQGTRLRGEKTSRCSAPSGGTASVFHTQRGAPSAGSTPNSSPKVSPSTSTSTPRTTPGISACAWFRTPIFFWPSVAAKLRW